MLLSRYPLNPLIPKFESVYELVAVFLGTSQWV